MMIGTIKLDEFASVSFALAPVTVDDSVTRPFGSGNPQTILYHKIPNRGWVMDKVVAFG